MSATTPDHVSSIADLVQAGEGASGRICTVFAVLRSLREGTTKDGRPYFDVVLSDTTGSVAGKIWDDAPRAIEAARGLDRGRAVKVLFEPSAYRGVLQLKVRNLREVDADDEADADFDPDRVHGAGWELVQDLVCKTLVFDIETVPATDLRKVPPTIAQAVTKHADRTDADEGKVMSLSPWFGKVVSLALGEGEADAESQTVTVLAVPPPGREGDTFPAWMRMMSEPELLRAFWLLAARAEVVVTYNGRGFDVPFLVARSLIHQIPVNVDLMGFGLRPHLDLHRVLSSGGAKSGGRSLGPSSLDVVCWSLGITSPKGEMDGSMVAPTYARGDIEMIAEYNAGDVRATSAVYRHAVAHLLRFRDDW